MTADHVNPVSYASELFVTLAYDLFAVWILLLPVGLTVAQIAPLREKWVGTWTLEVSKSTIGTPLVPGSPIDLTFNSLTMKIEETGRSITLSGDYVVTTGGKAMVSHESNTLSFDRETVVGSLAFVFRRIDDFDFEIVSRLIGNSAFGVVSRFALSADGNVLTETKTQKLDSGGPVRTSTTVLVFDRKSQSRSASSSLHPQLTRSYTSALLFRPLLGVRHEKWHYRTITRQGRTVVIFR